MGDKFPPLTTVVFAWGSSVFSCSDQTWEMILQCVARQSEYKLEEITQKRCTRLADRPLVQLGLMTVEEAQTRLAARKTALAGIVDENPPVVRQRFEQPRRIA